MKYKWDRLEDGSLVGTPIYEAGDTKFEMIGSWRYVAREPTPEPYSEMAKEMVEEVLHFLKDTAHSWKVEDVKFIYKSKADYGDLTVVWEDNAIGTLGWRVTLSRIVEEGECT